MLKKKPVTTAPKLTRNEVALVHNNPLFSATRAIHVNPLFEPPKNPESEYEEEDEQLNDSAHEDHEHEGEPVVWYKVTDTKVEVKMEEEEEEEEDAQFSQRELWKQPHNEVLRRERKKQRDDKQNYSYPMMQNGKMVIPHYLPPEDNRRSIYLSPRRSLPVLPPSFDSSSAAGSRSSVAGDPAAAKKRGRESDAVRSGPGHTFKCLLPNCERTFPTAFSLSEHCAQHSFDFKEFIRRNEEELKRTRTM